VAFVGAGGKTTALFSLARALKQAIVTTTTHLGEWQATLADRHVIVESPGELAELATTEINGVILVSGRAGREGRLAGLDAPTLDALHSLTQSRQIPLLIEADGARQLPLKAPADHEPALPQFADVVIVTAGLSALGAQPGPSLIHRFERFQVLDGESARQFIQPEMIARVLLHVDGGQKRIPAGARRIALLHQADSPELQAAGGRLATLLKPGFDAVLLSTAEMHRPPLKVLAIYEPSAGIVLAAGAAQRYGLPKQLLAWEGQPLVRHVTRIALSAGLDPVVVVTGAYAQQVEASLQGLAVQIVRCETWEAGQSESLRCGLGALSNAGSAIFLLADQPYVSPVILQALVEQHARTLAPIVAPLVDGQRSNPVLFDRQVFPALRALKGDVGGRGVFGQFRVTWFPWHDGRLLLDIDTVEDYQRLTRADGTEKL